MHASDRIPESLSSLRAPFEIPGLVVLGAVAALGSVPYGGWIAWPLAVLWSMLVIRGTLAGKTSLSPLPLAGETADLLPLWGRGLAATAFVALPYGMMVAARYTSIAFPDSRLADTVDQVAIGVGAILTLINACFYPAVLALAATEVDLLFFLSPRAINAMSRKVWFSMAVGFVGLFALLFVPGKGGLLNRVAGFALLFLVARLIGIGLASKPEPRTAAVAKEPSEGNETRV